MRSSSVSVAATFVPDPNDPTQDHCAPDLTAHNDALVTVRVTDAAGAPIAQATVRGRILDDYWTDFAVSGRTDVNGEVAIHYTGLCGVGAITFLVDDVTKAGWALDRTAGILTSWAIPQ